MVIRALPDRRGWLTAASRTHCLPCRAKRGGCAAASAVQLDDALGWTAESPGALSAARLPALQSRRGLPERPTHSRLEYDRRRGGAAGALRIRRRRRED